MTRVQAVDTFLIGRVFGPASWFVQRRTGWNNFRQARTLVLASPALMFVWTIMVTRTLLGYGLMSIACLMWLSVCWWKLTDLRRDEQHAKARPEVFAWFISMFGFMRLFSLAMFLFLDMFSLILVAAEVRGVLWIALPCRFYSTFYGIALYLAAIPPPPRKEKQRKVLWFFKPLPVPT